MSRSSITRAITWGLVVFVSMSCRNACDAQCHTIHTHAWEGVCGGHVSVVDCPGDSVIWSNGASGWTAYLDPGSYSYTVYQGGAVFYSGYANVQTVGWDFADSIHGLPWGWSYAITGNAFVNYCGTTMYDHSCCVPEGADVYLLQDGVNILYLPCVNCTDIWCVSTSFIIHEVPYGHQYVVCISDPSCAGTCATDQPITVPSCGNLELVTSISGTIAGENNGSIELVEAIPDTTEPYPIQAPVMGSISLTELSSGLLVGTQLTNAGSALWTGLDTGYYVLYFQPDAGCQSAWDTLYVPAETSTGMDRLGGPALSARPTITDGTLVLSSSISDQPVHIRIVDMHGRTILTTMLRPGPLSVDALLPGAYLLVAAQGEVLLRSRFVKR